MRGLTIKQIRQRRYRQLLGNITSMSAKCMVIGEDVENLLTPSERQTFRDFHHRIGRYEAIVRSRYATLIELENANGKVK